MAHFSQDPVLLEGFARAGHSRAHRPGSFWRGADGADGGASPRLESDQLRIIYGLSPFGLAQQIGVPQKEAAQFISAYLSGIAASKNISTMY